MIHHKKIRKEVLDNYAALCLPLVTCINGPVRNSRSKHEFQDHTGPVRTSRNSRTCQDLHYSPGTLRSAGPQRPSRFFMLSSIFQAFLRTPGTSTTSRTSQDLPGRPILPGIPGSCSSHRDPIELKQRDPIKPLAKLHLAAFPLQTVSFLYCIIQIVYLSLLCKPPRLKPQSDSSSLLCMSASLEFHFFSGCTCINGRTNALAGESKKALDVVTRSISITTSDFAAVFHFTCSYMHN